MTQSNQDIDQAAKMAGLVGQLGCVTGFASIVIIAIAFAAGRFLDSKLGTDGILTVLFLLGSFPITLYVIVRISLSAVARNRKSMATTQVKEMESDNTTEEEA